MAAPLKARDKVIGVIVAGNKTGRPFSERDQAMLTAVADYAVVGIVNAWLFQAMEARLQNLQQAYDALLHAGLSQQAGAPASAAPAAPTSPLKSTKTAR